MKKRETYILSHGISREQVTYEENNYRAGTMGLSYLFFISQKKKKN